MTPQEAEWRMRQIIATVKDVEEGHMEMDELLCTILVETGYEETVKLFKKTPKWYA